MTQDSAAVDPAEQALRQSEQQLRNLIEGSIQGILIHDEKGKALFVNQAFATIYGFDTPEEVLKCETLDHLIPPEERGRILAFRAARLRGEPAPEIYETRRFRRDGTTIWLDNRSRAIEWNGQPAIQAVVVDITERKQAEDALRTSAAALSQANRIAKLGHYTWSATEKRLLSRSQSYLDILGLSADPASGTFGGLESVLHPDDRTRVMAESLATEAEGRGLQIEYRVVHPDGTIVHVRELSQPIPGNPGGPQEWFGTIQDISDIKKAEGELRQSETRFRSAFETIGHGMAIVATDGRFVNVNEALTSILGYSEEELRHRNFQSITHPDDLAADIAQVRRLLEGKDNSYEMEKRYFHKDGHTIWAQLNVGLIRDAEGRPLYFLSQIHDITRRKQVEEARQRMEAALGQAQKLAGLGYYRWSKGQQRLVSCNDEYRRILGQPLEPAPIDPRGIRPFLHPNDRECIDKAHKDAEAAGVGVQIEFRIVRPNGAIRYVRDLNEPEAASEGMPETWFGTIQDITEQRQTEHALLDYQGRLDMALQAAKAAYWELDVVAGTHKLMESYYSMLGYTFEESPRERQAWLDLIHPDDVDRLQAGQNLPPFDDRDHEYEFRIRAKDGSWRWMLSRYRVTAFDDSGHPIRLQGVDSDITARKEAELSVHHERNRARLYLDVAGAILVVLDIESRVVLLNRRGSEILGIPEKDAVGKNWFDAFSPPGEREAQRASFAAFLAGERGPGQDIEMTLVTASGEIHLIFWHDTLLRNEAGQVVGGISSGEDITVRRQLEARLEELVIRDELTGAYNRRHFLTQAPQEIQRALRYRRPLSFIFLDLDHFKSINDQFGHAIGDEALKAFSRLGRTTFRPADLFARFGGEEFVVMLPETNLNQAIDAVERLRSAMRDVEISANPPVRGLTASIGISELHRDADSLDAILDRIDKATYRAKELGRDRIEVCADLGIEAPDSQLTFFGQRPPA